LCIMKTLAKRIGILMAFILVFEMLVSGLWPLRTGVPTAEASGLGPDGVPEKAYLIMDGQDWMSASADDSIRVGQVITGPLSAMTAEAWVKVDPDKPSGTIIDYDYKAYFELSLRDDKIVFDTFGNNDQDEMIAQADFRDDEWHHIAVVFDGIYKLIYMDGVQVGKKQLFENKGLLGNGSTGTASLEPGTWSIRTALRALPLKPYIPAITIIFPAPFVPLPYGIWCDRLPSI